MQLIIQYLRPYFKRMSLGLAIKLFGTVMDLLLPLILAHVIDQVAPTKNMKLVLLWGGLMVLCSIMALLCNVVANRRHLRWREIPLPACGMICLRRSPFSPTGRWISLPSHR